VRRQRAQLGEGPGINPAFIAPTLMVFSEGAYNAMAGSNETDPAGTQGGDKGKTHPKGKGGQAEKGDWRREDEHTGEDHPKGRHEGRSGKKAGQ
jgi:hypothetical protein